MQLPSEGQDHAHVNFWFVMLCDLWHTEQC